MNDARAGSAGSGVVDGIDVDAVYAAVLDCPGVASLGSGQIGEPATYLPGRRVCGVRVSPAVVELEVCAVWGFSADGIGNQIWGALAAIVTDRPIDVRITDITDLAASNHQQLLDDHAPVESESS